MGTRGRPRQFHPELRAAWWLPPLPVGPRALALFRRGRPALTRADGVQIAEHHPSSGTRSQRARVFTPAVATHEPRGAVFWVHGGGFVIGSPEQDDESNAALARTADVVVVAPSYRLAPENPGPVALEDLVEAYRWMLDRAEDLGIDPARVVVAGASAGGGLAALLVQWLHDHAAGRGWPQPVAQVLLYPMLDDRTCLDPAGDRLPTRVWSATANRFGWRSRLGFEPGTREPDAYLVAARREDLSGLPPAWIGVGSLDLFNAEDHDYAERLWSAGVPTDLYVVPGAVHAFDKFWANTEVSRAWQTEWFEVVRRATAGVLTAG